MKTTHAIREDRRLTVPMARAVVVVMPRLVMIVIAVWDKFAGVVVVVAGVVVVGTIEVAGAVRVVAAVAEVTVVVANAVVANAVITVAATVTLMTVTVVASVAAEAKIDSKSPRLRSRRTQDRKCTNRSTRKQCPFPQFASRGKLRLEVISILTATQCTVCATFFDIATTIVIFTRYGIYPEIVIVPMRVDIATSVVKVAALGA